MDLQEALIRIQTAYPRIYLACHSRHQNARTTIHKLSPRDSALLAHLSERDAVGQSDLAGHMGVAKSTLSEALSNLEECGFVVRVPQADDGRGALIRRTAAGTEAMSSGSVLETVRLLDVLQCMTGEEILRAVEGLELIARAAVALSERKKNATKEASNSI